MDMDTFLTELYVLVDDWYKTVEAQFQRHWTGRQQMSDSEVLTVALAGQWRVGVPWQSERGVIRWMQAHGRGWFPKLLQRSAFNRRVRCLWQAFVQLQQALAARLNAIAPVYEVIDCVPLPAHSLAQAVSEQGHWLWWSLRAYGGTQGGWYMGDTLLMSCTPQGAVTGWLICPANADDRWCLQAFLSYRAGKGCLVAPAARPRTGKKGWLTTPVGQFLPRQAVGTIQTRYYLADRGFNGARWQHHWRQWGAEVVTIPPENAPEAAQWRTYDRYWLSRLRQTIETVFATLTTVFGLQSLNAHSRWGQLTRVATLAAAFNVGLWLNQQHQRPFFALATLIC